MVYRPCPHGLNVSQSHSLFRKRLTWIAVFHHPRSALLGLVSAVYSLGGIVALPIVPSVVDKFGRRRSILIGSIVMIIGGILQGAALNRK